MIGSPADEGAGCDTTYIMKMFKLMNAVAVENLSTFSPAISKREISNQIEHLHQFGRRQRYLIEGTLPMAINHRTQSFGMFERLPGAGVLAGLAAMAVFSLAAALDTYEPQLPRAAAADPDDPKLAGHFAGRVIGPDGEPVTGARLFITQNDPPPKEAGPVRATSGADGHFEFDAADMASIGIDGLPTRRKGFLIATADRYQPAWVVTWGHLSAPTSTNSNPVRGADLTLRLGRGDVPIHGRLLDPKGQPLAGARVRLHAIKLPREGGFDEDLKRFENTNGETWPFFAYRSVDEPSVLPGIATEATADADGRFRLAGLGRDRLAELLITAPGSIETYLTVMTRDAPDLVFGRDADGYSKGNMLLGAGFTFRLKPGRTVRGIVRDRETRAPIAGMWVGQVTNALSGLAGDPSPFTSNANGRYEISGIDPAIRDLEVMAVPQPGQPYFMAKASVGEKSGAMIDCLRGIPFRLKVVDEAGEPVEGEVESHPVTPNPHAVSVLPHEWTFGFPISRALMTAKGVYEGVVIAGPGAVMVRTPGRADYRPAHVDPKTFFAPGKSDWSDQDLISAYGTHDTLSIGNAQADQHDYAAIVLVNAALDSKPLELSATVARDRPRQVTILDPEGKPIVGVKPVGLTGFTWDDEPALRAATVPIAKLHPTRSRRITFIKEDRKLIGFLLARGDGEAPYAVRLEPWATVTGRVVDENGNPFPPRFRAPGRPAGPVFLRTNGRFEIATHDDALAGTISGCGSDGLGRFRIERLVPGLRYSCDIYHEDGPFAGLAFEDLVLKPGETRDLGDIRWKKPVDMRGK
jgi:hypothetical protein